MHGAIPHRHHYLQQQHIVIQFTQTFSARYFLSCPPIVFLVVEQSFDRLVGIGYVSGSSFLRSGYVTWILSPDSLHGVVLN
jgi:hypothetical protein